MNNNSNFIKDTTKLQGAPTYKVTYLPLIIFVSIAVFIKLVLLFTKVRFNFRNKEAITKVVDFGALVLALIIANTVSKYDDLGASVTAFIINIGHLQKIALEYDPSSICYLIDTLKVYENIDYAMNNQDKMYSIHDFENKIVPIIKEKNEVEASKVTETVKIVNELLHKKLDATDTISNEFWYLVFFGLIILSLLLLFDKHFGRFEGFLAVLLIWGPVTYIYYLYYNRNKFVDVTIASAIEQIKKNNVICK